MGLGRIGVGVPINEVAPGGQRVRVVKASRMSSPGIVARQVSNRNPVQTTEAPAVTGLVQPGEDGLVPGWDPGAS